ncbi:FecCD family ABC transporter permease [Vallitalea guaymasensis]|uniref:FecCD family ABC transporter permease n=1 Tax=Vallitalea guaymasensis TaxID=1185412 RepID=UPI0023530FA3|nr:iron ABC transporter permease [Vallitalea guaymasensis]
MNIKKNSTMTSYKNVAFLVVILLIIVSCISLLVGRYDISISDIIKIFSAKINNSSLPDKLEISSYIIWDIRIPRIILAGMVGACIAIAGTCMQGLLQNPLVSPDVLGVSSGAGFGAALGIILTSNNLITIQILSFAFGITSMALVFLFSKGRKDQSILSIILSGIIVSSVFTSLISITKYVADAEEKLPAITFWLMGSFSNASYDQIKIIILPVMIGIVGLTILRWKINILSLGDDEAFTMGVNPKRLRWIIIILCTVMVSSTVTVAGIIGWIGLVIPHICRKIIGYNHGYLVPLSGLTGAAFLIIVDCLARNISSSEIPIGILTALIGAPIFAFLFMYKRGEV